MRFPIRETVALTLVHFVLNNPAVGSIIAGDHFNLDPIGTQLTDLGTGTYTEDAAVVGSGPAVTGFNSGTNWAGSTIKGTFVTPTGAGLSYVDSNGHSISSSGGMAQYTGPTGSSTALDRITRASNDSTSSTTYFASALFNIGSFANSTDQGLMEIKFSQGTYVQFGLRDQNAVIFSVAGGSITGTQPAAAATGSNAYSAGTTHLLVLKIVGQAGGSDAVSLFIDPTDLAAESGTPLTVTGGLDLLPDAGDKLALIGLYGGRTLGTSNSASFDEIRVGTTWADVIPEPSMAVLFPVIAAGALLLRRRRGSCA